MITERIRTYAVILALALKDYKAQGFSDAAALALADADALNVVPLSDSERETVRNFAGRGKLQELLPE